MAEMYTYSPNSKTNCYSEATKRLFFYYSLLFWWFPFPSATDECVTVFQHLSVQIYSWFCLWLFQQPLTFHCFMPSISYQGNPIHRSKGIPTRTLTHWHCKRLLSHFGHSLDSFSEVSGFSPASVWGIKGWTCVHSGMNRLPLLSRRSVVSRAQIKAPGRGVHIFKWMH